MATQPVGGAQPAQNSSDSVNGGRNQTIPAIPAVNGSAGHNQDHSRKSSMTVTPSGANYNGGAVGGPQNKSSIQFGNLPSGSSPATGNAALPQHGNPNLGVNQLNPNQRASSPHVPSPIPQPIEPSGGRPPPQFGQNGMVFGQHDNEQSVGFAVSLHDLSTNVLKGQPRPVSNLQFGNHDRRGSSHSTQSDFGGNPNLPTGPNTRNYQSPAGRGNRGGYNGGYQPQMPYSPHNSFRGQQGGRGMPFPGGRNQQVPGYPGHTGSPSMGTRNPAMMNPQPGTPQQMHLSMQPNGMQGNQPSYYPYQQVIMPSLSSVPEPIRGKMAKTRGNGRGEAPRGRGKARGGRGGKGPSEDRMIFSRDPASDNHPANVAFRVQFHHFPDLSPASGNFESLHKLTKQPQGANIAIDPSIQQNYMQNVQMAQGYYPPQYMNQSSPRPYQQGYGVPMQPTYSNQGQAPSMSRASSQMSNAPDRPGSSVGHQPHTPSMPTSSMPVQSSSRAPSMSSQKPPNSAFTIPEKKKTAIVIKNPNTGEALNFKDKAPASPAPISAVAPATPSNPTPPSRTPSAVEQTHTRAESTSTNTKTDEERKRAMQEAVKQRIAEQAKEQAKLEGADDQKAELDQEKSDAAKVEAKEAEAIAEKLEEEAEAAEPAKEVEKSEPAKVVEKSDPTPAPAASAEKSPVATPAKPAADDDEIDFDAIEAELAAQEAEEARIEAEYQKKKSAQKAAQAQREKHEAESYEANMKEEERKAEELERQREKERETGNTSDDESKRLFAELKSGVKTPASTDTPAEATPSGPSGAATPVSDVSMPPPARAGLAPKRGKAAELTLDTKKPIEPPEPSATMKALQSAKPLSDLSKVTYPTDIASPNPALNQSAPAARGFKYEKSFLLQFQPIFKEKPSVDWDVKIREVMGDGEQSARTARTPSSSMGGRQLSARGGPPNAFAGGAMGSFRPPLPPGTTSEQRFAMSNAGGMGRGVPMPNPFGGMGRGGGMAMGRQPSNTMPGSPRVGGSRNPRVESKQKKQNTRQMAEENKSMPLTAGLNVGTLETTSTGWKPRSVGQVGSLGPAPGGEGHLGPEEVQRKVKAALNKMTPEKFEKIGDQILAITAQSKDEADGRTLRQVIQLTFDKATDEAHWASMYAKFCRKMLESMNPDVKDENIKDKTGAAVAGGNLFRKYLLNRCQEEFERGWKVNIPAPKEGQDAEAAILSDEYYVAMAAKRRGLGLVKFIGELFKLGMLTERIMHECVKKLVDYEGTPDEAEIESLTSLLRTIGRQLDDPASKGQGRMDVYFERITAILNMPDLNSRLKYMLMDIIDLRKNHWSSKDDEKGPKTITQIHQDAERQQQADEAARLAQQANRGRGGPMAMGRGDARSFSYNQMPPPDNSNRVATDDLRRLGASRSNRNASNTGGIGGPALLGPRTNSGRRGLGPGSSFNRGDDSNASSRTGTPPGPKKDDKKDEASTNSFG